MAKLTSLDSLYDSLEQSYQERVQKLDPELGVLAVLQIKT